MVRLGIELNSDSSLLFSTFLKNKSYFIQIFQILSHKVKLRNSQNKLEMNSDFKKSNTQTNNFHFLALDIWIALLTKVKFEIARVESLLNDHFIFVSFLKFLENNQI